MDETVKIEGEGESAEELIIRITRKADGIGAAKAGAIAADFNGDLQAFLKADSERLSRVRTSAGSY